MNQESLNRQKQQMTLKPVPISWSIQGDFIHGHHNELRVQLYVPKEEHSLFHWWMLLVLLKLIWMCYKRNELTITGMSIRADICQILGKDSQNSLCWKRNLQKVTRGLERDWQRFKLPDQIMHVQKFGRKKRSWGSESRETGMGKRETKARQCSKNERNLGIYFIIQMTKSAT